MSLIVLLVLWTTRARCRLLTLIFLLLKETPRLGVMVALFLLSQVSNKHVQTQCTYLPILSLCPSVRLSICYPTSPYTYTEVMSLLHLCVQCAMFMLLS